MNVYIGMISVVIYYLVHRDKRKCPSADKSDILLLSILSSIKIWPNKRVNGVSGERYIGSFQSHAVPYGLFCHEGSSFICLSNGWCCPEEMRKLSVSKSSPGGRLSVFLIDIKSGASYNSISVCGIVGNGARPVYDLCVVTLTV